MNDRVFIYGTLMQGEPYHHLIQPFVVSTFPAWVPGLLLDLGDYPGWVEGEDRVYGELLRLHSVQRALMILDRFEDFRGPGNPANLYDRISAEVNTEAGPVRAWCYRYRGDRTEARPLAGGRWRGRGR